MYNINVIFVTYCDIYYLRYFNILIHILICLMYLFIIYVFKRVTFKFYLLSSC